MRRGVGPAAPLAVIVTLVIATNPTAQVLIGYLYGAVELEDNRGWWELFIGEEVSPAATIRLDDHFLA